MSLGERLKELREAKGLSKSALAEKIQLHYSQIGRYERNEASPSSDMLKKLANELNVTTDYIMNGTSDDMANDSIQDKTLLNQFKRISALNTENRRIVTELIDAFLFKQEMKNKLA
jgi:transcriptional regulator with XRE-family HTH domain